MKPDRPLSPLNLIRVSLRTDILAIVEKPPCPIITDLGGLLRIVQSLTFLPLGSVTNRVPL